MHDVIHKGERVDYLPPGRRAIIQSDDVFSFSMDAVLLAYFAYLPIRQGRVLDLCSGNGAVALMCSMRTQACLEGVEIQERLVDMARRSVRLNKLQGQVSMQHMDLRQAPGQLGYGQYDVVLCNPPYLPVMQGEHKQKEALALARHEMMCTLEDVVRVMSDLVRTKGKVALVHRPSRLVSLLSYMRKYGVEPKRLRFVHPLLEKEANMVLVEGIKGGAPELRLEPPIVAYDGNRRYSSEMRAIFQDQQKWGIKTRAGKGEERHRSELEGWEGD